jgi:hypothetical protein
VENPEGKKTIERHKSRWMGKTEIDLGVLMLVLMYGFMFNIGQ